PRHFPKPRAHPKKIIETITANMYCNEFSEMCRKPSVIRPTLINRKGLILLHDNTRPYKHFDDFIKKKAFRNERDTEQYAFVHSFIFSYRS
ncbi:Histone-lysine N-methyltransferase SETMAR, partial [Habropoda laboriosa]